MRTPCLRGKAALARQRGQALAFALIFLVVGALALFTAFNASQLSSAKTKLQNTADATAYSVAVLQARDYNFAAYTNRAMVANQAAVAQVLSLKSWIDEVSETAQSDHVTDTLIDIFADLGEVEWNLPKQTARPIISPLKSTIDSLAPTVVKGLDILNWSLSEAQQAYHLTTMLSYPLVAKEVAQANEPNTTADEGYMATLGAPKLLAWKNYVTRTDPKQQASGGGGSDRFADVVTDKDTLDNFVPERGKIRTPTVASTAEKGCVGAVFSFMAVGEPHSGATQLRPDLGGWEALDGTAAIGDLTCIWATPVGPVGFTFPIIESLGRGGAANGPGGSYSGRSGYNNTGHIGDAIVSAATVATFMQYETGPGSSLDNSSRAGLQPYYDLSDPNKAAPGTGTENFNRAPTITLQVKRNVDTTRTTKTMQVGVGRTQLDEAAPSSELRALSSASAYFIRPRSTGGPGGLLNAAAWRRGDNRFEYPSLFNPYWQPSLVDTSATDLEAAAVAQAAGAP
ncbi:TadE/TadG family type IV pilus assembly protein [Ralstonia soli]|uniref:Tad domain-containing protein n=1 Tax=Ralstonia soli TaxID=2953896 RepID=A0ABT1AER1_9RALS|nr:Tad domain-containing protein [Ralstonia soli]MCO5396870.1 Tad domain-containing protein [Ralstonia soli]